MLDVQECDATEINSTSSRPSPEGEGHLHTALAYLSIHHSLVAAEY